MSVLNTTNNPIAVKSTEPISSQPNSDFILTNKLTSQVVGSDDGVGAVRYMAEQMEGVPIEDAIGNLLVNPDKVTGSLNALKFAAQNQKSEILTINSENSFRTELYATINTQSLLTSVTKSTELTPQPVTNIATTPQLPQRETTSSPDTNFASMIEATTVSELTSLDSAATLPIENNKILSTSSNSNVSQNSAKEVVAKSSNDKIGSKKQDQNNVENSENAKRDIQADFKQSTTDTRDTKLAQNASIEREIIGKSKGENVEYIGAFPMHNQREQQHQRNQEEEKRDQDNVEIFQSVSSNNKNRTSSSNDFAQSLFPNDGIVSLVKNTNTEFTQFSTEFGSEGSSKVETIAQRTLQKSSNAFEVGTSDLADKVSHASTFISQLTNSISGSSNIVGNSLLAGADISLSMTNLVSNTNIPIAKTNIVANSLSAGAGIYFLTSHNAFAKGSGQSIASNLGAEFGIRSSSFSAAELRAVPGRTAPPIQNAEFIAQQRIMRHLASLWARSFGLGTGLSIVNEILSHPEKWGIGHELVVT